MKVPFAALAGAKDWLVETLTMNTVRQEEENVRVRGNMKRVKMPE